MTERTQRKKGRTPLRINNGGVGLQEAVDGDISLTRPSWRRAMKATAPWRTAWRPTVETEFLRRLAWRSASNTNEIQKVVRKVTATWLKFRTRV